MTIYLLFIDGKIHCGYMDLATANNWAKIFQELDHKTEVKPVAVLKH